MSHIEPPHSASRWFMSLKRHFVYHSGGSVLRVKFLEFNGLEFIAKKDHEELDLLILLIWRNDHAAEQSVGVIRTIEIRHKNKTFELLLPATSVHELMYFIKAHVTAWSLPNEIESKILDFAEEHRSAWVDDGVWKERVN